MIKSRRRLLVVTFQIFLLFTVVSPAAQTLRLPADSAGITEPPTGQIAFIRNGSIWVMDASGANQQLVCRVANAEGRLSWSPDNRRIVFTRSGLVDLKGPDLVGGRHKVYDLFVCSLDSVRAGNIKYWRRLTDDLGARGPEWSTDGDQILFWKDMNANFTNSLSPNYQLCVFNFADSSQFPLRNEWQTESDYFLVTPTMNKKQQIAFVFFSELQPGGLVVLPLEDISIDLDSIRTTALQNTGFVAPVWSPDDKWLAVIGNNPDAGGLYIMSPDLEKKYLVASPPERTRLSRIPPSFSADSKWLTFSTDDGSIWICDITGNGLKRLTHPGNDQAPCWSR